MRQVRSFVGGVGAALLVAAASRVPPPWPVGSLMEAMLVGTPVVARRNAGNCAIVNHGTTGFLFDTAPECHELCSVLLNDDATRVAVSAAATADMAARFGPEVETAAWLKQLRTAAGVSPCRGRHSDG